ncbi:hypothetical protein Ccar_22580 [Clostridium carboxidivorans P7]|uniref:Plasmid-related protein n=1 Tax=Clostridium carboxidivorans P7 TaxID=536227 RepID=C6PXS2_9CLOT|nr:YgaB family protein [Clostridium carboxidivorans]AKN33460.1 hypothetical protein Ccar_22580 [Clostridium carboxidivorans P7]EET85953.1 conserved hypothetical protein [Clostridium carboxidivorans P7]EFG89158.1 hypothetical protein CLCAR_1033 [Clostridium carboxidivorans P7]
MENKILELLNQLVDGQDKTNDKLDRIEKKIDSVIEQTADLTEFRTETKDKLESIDSEIKSIRKDLNAVEIVTSKNWNDIATLKAVK